MKHKSSPSVLIGFFIVLVFAAYSSPVLAAPTYWNVTAGDWFTSTNWSAGIPNCSSDAYINNDGKAEIGISGAFARTLTLGENAAGGSAADSGTLVVDGTNGAELFVGVGPGGSCDAPLIPGSIFVGNGGSGTLDIIDGAEVESGDGSIALGEVSNGTVTVDGEDSIWRVKGRLYIGAIPNSDTDGGTALLNVTNGGAVTVFNDFFSVPGVNVGASGTLTGNGTVTVTGTTSFSRQAAVRGTLAPTGTLEIKGNLHLDEAATTLCHVTPTASDMVEVSGASGTAVIDGHLLVILSGTFTQGEDMCTTRITLLHAAGGRLSGSEFASQSIQGIPLNAPYTAHIRYDSDNVYLDLDFTNCP